MGHCSTGSFLLYFATQFTSQRCICSGVNSSLRVRVVQVVLMCCAQCARVAQVVLFLENSINLCALCACSSGG